MTRDADLPGTPDAPNGAEGSFAESVRRAFVEGPSEDTARAHLAAMADAAREAAHTVPQEVVPVRKSWMSTRAFRYAAIAVASMVAAMSVGTGLSFAGVVTLPSPVRAVLHGVGIDVPDDDTDEQDEAETNDSGLDGADDQGADGDGSDGSGPGSASDEDADANDEADDSDSSGPGGSDDADDADDVDEPDDGDSDESSGSSDSDDGDNDSSDSSDDADDSSDDSADEPDDSSSDEPDED